MSGSNRLINSDNTKKGKSQDELASRLNNANNEAEDLNEEVETNDILESTENE